MRRHALKNIHARAKFAETHIAGANAGTALDKDEDDFRVARDGHLIARPRHLAVRPG